MFYGLTIMFYGKTYGIICIVIIYSLFNSPSRSVTSNDLFFHRLYNKHRLINNTAKFCPCSLAGICVITPITPLCTLGTDDVLSSTCLHLINPTAAVTLAELFRPPYWRCLNCWNRTTDGRTAAITRTSRTSNGGKTHGEDI